MVTGIKSCEVRKQIKALTLGEAICIKKWTDLLQIQVTGIKSCEVRKQIKALTLGEAIDIISAGKIYTTEVKNIDLRSCRSTLKYGQESKKEIWHHTKGTNAETVHRNPTKQCTSISCLWKKCNKCHKKNHLLQSAQPLLYSNGGDKITRESFN